MSKELVQFETEDGEVFTIESSIADDDGSDVELVSDGPDVTVVKAQKSFESALKQIRPATNAIFNAFKELNQPSQIELEFGVKIGAKAGVVLASVDSEVTFKVKLAWDNK